MFQNELIYSIVLCNFMSSIFTILDIFYLLMSLIQLFYVCISAILSCKLIYSMELFYLVSLFTLWSCFILRACLQYGDVCLQFKAVLTCELVYSMEFFYPVSLFTVLSCLQVLTKDITVIEGGLPGEVLLKLTVPPRLLCQSEDRANNSCYVQVISHFSEKEQLCPNSNRLNQAVIGYR